MKTTFLTGLSLTLIMLLLVLSAAFWFLYQGRQALQERLDEADQEVAALETALDDSRADHLAAEATRQSSAAALATAESDSVLLEGQLVKSQQTVDEQLAAAAALSAELADARANLTQLQQQQEEAQQRRPEVQFVAPEAGAILVVGEPVEVIAAAADPTGIAAFSLTLGQEPLQSYAVADEPLFTARREWQPEAAGTYTLNAVATNSLGLVSSLITTTVQVIERDTRSSAILAQIEANVSGIRGLEADQPANVLFVEATAGAQAPAAPNEVSIDLGWQPDVLTLASFDLLPEGTNLDEARVLLQAQLGLAAHDPSLPERILTQADGQLDLAAEVAHVHQFAHALQAQHHGLDFTKLNALDFDARLAFYGLVEGEAALVESLYLDQGSLYSGPASPVTNSAEEEVAAAVLQALPPYLLNEYSFPRAAGNVFVMTLYEQGQDSFSLINDAWQNPPSSSEQILHPERYLADDDPRPVALPRLSQALGTGWALAQDGRMGEFFLRQYLGQQLNEAQVETAATGWGGDRFAVYQNVVRNETVMVLRLQWDGAEDSSEFAAIYPNYPTRLYNVSGELQPNGAECWRASDVICFYQLADETFIWRTPDLAKASLIAQELNLGEAG